MWIWIANKLQNFTQKDLTEVKKFLKVLKSSKSWNTLYTCFATMQCINVAHSINQDIYYYLYII